MSIINIISAIGNNDSVYPLLIRDCGIENVAKCALTYKQNAKESKYAAKEATRERIIDEYSTSAVWLGGVPLLNKTCDKFIKKSGLAPEINLKLFGETSAQGINLNIEKFKNKLPDIVEQLKKAKADKTKYQNLQIVKFFATTAIPVAIMGFLLPKLNFLYTKNKNKKNEQNQTNKNNQISFTGLSRLANMSNLEKMMILDGGLTIGRVKTGRNKAEKAEMGLKMGLMCYLNYIAPKNIEKMFNKITKAIFGINTSLDVKLLNDKTFMEELKNKTLLLPKENGEKAVIDFIDENISSSFVKQAQNLGLVSVLKENIRDPRKFVETDKIVDLKKSIEEFASDAIKSGDFEKFRKQALKAKSFNILANIALSSFLLAVILPKIQFWFRKIMTNSTIDPGIKKYVENNK